jgi:hypothetical protein
MYDPWAAVSLPSPAPFSWAGALAVLSHPHLQQLLLGWVIRTLPSLLLSWLRLRNQQQQHALPAAPAAVDSKRGCAAAAQLGGAAAAGGQCDAGGVAASSSSNLKAAVALRLRRSPAAEGSRAGAGPGLAPEPGAGPKPGAGAGSSIASAGGAVTAAAAVANLGDQIRMAQLHPRALALKPGGWRARHA